MAHPGVGVTVFRAGCLVAEVGRAQRPADGLAVAGGVVIASGAVAELSDRWPDARLIDLGKRWLMPALEDAHCHPTIAADELCHVSLSADSQREVGAVAQAIRESGRSNGWVKLVGWLESRCGGAEIDRRLLDRLCPTEPLVLVHANGHWGYVNSAGLQRMGFVDDDGAVIAAAIPSGGWVEAAAGGAATGRVFEQAMFDIMEPALARDPARVALAGPDDRLAALRRVQQDYLARGVTSLTEALCSETGWELLESVQGMGRAPRYAALVAAGDTELVQKLRARDSAGVHLVGLKSFVDGALNGGTCLLSEPAAAGEPQQLRGVEEIAAELELARSLGLRLGVHANGDAAIDVVLQASDRVRSSGRIEHGSVIRDDQVATIRRQGWSVVPFGSYIREHGSRMAETYGAERLGGFIRHRTLMSAGIPVAGSSDYPCAGFDPWEALWSCVTRQSADGAVLGPEESLSPTEALRLYTVGSAAVRPQPGRAGTLHPGAPADFMVLDVDPRSRGGLKSMLTTPVAATFVAGQAVHGTADLDVTAPEERRDPRDPLP